MPTVVVFDCESDGRPTRVGSRGEKDFQLVQCTCACALVIPTAAIAIPEAADALLSESRWITCWRDVIAYKGANPFQKLIDAFDEAELIVGFNTLEFDFPLLRKYYGQKNRERYHAHLIKSLDVFSRIRAVTNEWPSLGALLSNNGLAPKCGDGANAITLWNEQRRPELEAYCRNDVKRTAELALLPRLRMGERWIPSHVYGIGPAVQATFVSRVQADMTDMTDAPRTPTPESPKEAEWCEVLNPVTSQE